MNLCQNRHTITVRASAEQVGPEIIRWGEAGWWPKDSLMRFTRREEGPVRVGARYRQAVLLPFAPSWDVEVTAVTAQSVTRRFLNGMFRGQETVSLEAAGQETRVDYVMEYRVVGFLNRLLWPAVFRRLHDRNIESILKGLKDHLEAGREPLSR